MEGEKNLPVEGPVIIAANHVSNLDPVVVGCAFDRKVSYLAKEELFQVPVLSWIIRHLGAFPVKRGTGDRGAIRAALDVLEKGDCFGIFPEGTRSKDGNLQQPKLGVAMLAAKTGAPVLPVALINTQRLLAPITVRVGQVIKPPWPAGSKVSKEELEAFAQQIMAEIKRLREK
ncbi:MAG: lysophospholipid acyltransferase family protein [Bacillota bacterium]|nr:1-acyl-sn-glycerol-3-phosphate acyltransferase [Carboxydocella sp. ULO1]GAW32461.1 1-acyl-sn-glycerol-3-phosphate acyltransferase [Carboxydocella sp. JDF658]